MSREIKITYIEFSHDKSTQTKFTKKTSTGTALWSTGLLIRARNRKIIFLFFSQNIFCGYSKEPSKWDGSFEHPKHMLKMMGKKIFTILGQKKKLDSLAPLHCPQNPRITDFLTPKKEKKKNSALKIRYFISSMLVHYLIFLIHLPDLLKIE